MFFCCFVFLGQTFFLIIQKLVPTLPTVQLSCSCKHWAEMSRLQRSGKPLFFSCIPLPTEFNSGNITSDSDLYSSLWTTQSFIQLFSHVQLAPSTTPKLIKKKTILFENHCPPTGWKNTLHFFTCKISLPVKNPLLTQGQKDEWFGGGDGLTVKQFYLDITLERSCLLVYTA